MAELPDGYIVSLHPQVKSTRDDLGLEIDLRKLKDLVFCQNCEHSERSDLGNNRHEYACKYWDKEGPGFAVPDDGFCHAGIKRQNPVKEHRSWQQDRRRSEQ